MHSVTIRMYLKKYRLRFLLIIVCTTASAGLAAAGPLLLGNATTVIFAGIMAKLDGTGRMDFDAIARILRTTMALYLLSTLFASVSSQLAAGISGELAHRLRCAVAGKLNALPIGYYEEHAAGETMACVAEDAETVGRNIGQGALQMLTAVLTILGTVAMMFFISPVLAVCTVFLFLPAWAALWLMSRRSEKWVKRDQELQAQADGRIEEYYTGRGIVKVFGQEQEAAAEFSRIGQTLSKAAWRADFFSGAIPLVMQLFGNVGYVLAALLGGVLAFDGRLSVGGIQAYIHYIRNLIDPLRQTAQSVTMLQSASAAWERIQTLLEESEEQDREVCDAEGQAGTEICDAKGRTGTETRDAEGQARTEIFDTEGRTGTEAWTGRKASGDRASGEIRFEHVSFGYGEEFVLRDFSAVIAPGQKAALTGVSGVGKTTLVKLLLRFYDCQEGEIYVDDREIRTYGRAELRSRFGVVMQDVWLLRGTVLDNICYGRPEASEEEARRAAAAVSADVFIERLPEGYYTVIDEEQGGLSRGQKQLLAIARALLADPEILILDEATSSVDTKTEQQIQEALQTLMRDRTCLVIAHRATTIRGADLVLRVE